MRLLPSDPDIATIVGRIKNGDIDLQPDFQRGEVWSKLRRQRLIDSILRDWHVPPIHVIENPITGKQEVLDGQQRLAAIRDFVAGEFAVDGELEPQNADISALDGKLFSELPGDTRRRFNQFTIRLFRIVDYKPSEPSELFFRLNQPASLTGAEQRNAFFGPVREQIKELVAVLEREKVDKGVLGFSNARMSYDDVLSRTALAIERGTLADKITSADLTDLYRTEKPLGDDTIRLIANAIRRFALGTRTGTSTKFNKATLFSWLIFLVRAELSGEGVLSAFGIADFISYFLLARNSAIHVLDSYNRMLAGCAPAGRLFATYENRSSSRVADVSSVILRDAVIWLTLEDCLQPNAVNQRLQPVRLERIHDAFNGTDGAIEDDLLARRLIDEQWSQLV